MGRRKGPTPSATEQAQQAQDAADVAVLRASPLMGTRFGLDELKAVMIGAGRCVRLKRPRATETAGWRLTDRPAPWKKAKTECDNAAS